MWFVLFYLPIFWLFAGVNRVVTGSDGRPQVAPTNIVRMCLRFAQAVFDKVENLVLGYAQDG